MPQPHHAQLRCIIYARYSSTGQREESITAQIRAMTAHAARHHYTIVGTYTDEAQSATTDDRREFLRLMGDLKHKRVSADVVLVHKLDRFARNRYDSAFYRREMQRVGTKLESVLEPLDGSPESVLMESLLEGMAEYYSLNLAREVRKGMQETALQGKHAGGKPPLGLLVTPERTYAIDPQTAPAVKLIFARFAQGDHYHAIAAELHAQGYTTGEGRPFRKTSFHGILTNPKYLGVYVFNRSAPKGPDGKRNHHQSKAPEEIITIPDAFPALIDRATWDACQARLTSRRLEHAPGAATAKQVYLLSGLGTCGICGARLKGGSQSYHTRIGKEYRQRCYYLCSHCRPPEKCPLPRVLQHELERAVVMTVKAQLFTTAAMRTIAKRAAAYALAQRKERSGEGKYLEKELAGLETKSARLVEAISGGGGAIPALVAELQRLEALKLTLRGRLDDWERSQGMTVTEEMILAKLQMTAGTLEGDDPHALRTLLQQYVRGVVVYPDGTADIQLYLQLDHNPPGGGGNRDQDCDLEWWRRAVPVHGRSPQGYSARNTSDCT